ncbi:MAG TPA: hypothetical protein VLK65_22630 [Vicinamibacteria bacterium]|nr:hypothetical protein [Vicinamibacteria bacterium]
MERFCDALLDDLSGAENVSTQQAALVDLAVFRAWSTELVHLVPTAQ